MGLDWRRFEATPGRHILRVCIFALLLAITLADPVADPRPQGNVYQFSGAVYVVGANGQAYSQAAPAICPNDAPQGCGNINIWNWCCLSGTTCEMLSNGVVGCCPSGGQCSGDVNDASVSTVTVYDTATTTVEGQQNTVVVQGGEPTTTTVVSGIYVPVTTSTTASEPVTVAAAGGGYCSTEIAHGPNLPTTARGDCGTILVINNSRSILHMSIGPLTLWLLFWCLGVVLYRIQFHL